MKKQERKRNLKKNFGSKGRTNNNKSFPNNFRVDQVDVQGNGCIKFLSMYKFILLRWIPIASALCKQCKCELQTNYKVSVHSREARLAVNVEKCLLFSFYPSDENR